MAPPDRSPLQHTLLLGIDESTYGAHALELLSAGRIACALSVGGDPRSPARAYKGDSGVPNEDALLVLEQDERVLLAVADGHYGHFASHALLRALADVTLDIPRTPRALLGTLRHAAQEAGSGPVDSATSLLAVVWHRHLGAGFGYSFGDCTCRVLGPTRSGQPLHRRTNAFVSPMRPEGFDAQRASFFDFELGASDALVLHTDGVDGCCYRQPERSLSDADLEGLYQAAGASAERLAQAILQAALQGVRGHPGGQDNIALIVAGA